MRTQCPNCKAVFKVPDEYKGKKSKCPKCKQSFVLDKLAPSSSNKPDNSAEQNKSLEGYSTTTQQFIEVHTGKPPQPKSFWLIIKDFFMFRIMIFPWVIIATFALVFTTIVMLCISDMFPQDEPAVSKYFPSSPVPDMLGLGNKWVFRIVGLFLIRVVFEWLILFFRMYTRLGDLQKVMVLVKEKLHIIQKLARGNEKE